MTHKRPRDAAHQTGLFRFHILADLLARPAEPGAQAEALRELSRKTFPDPVSGEERRFSIRTLERWLRDARGAERINESLQPRLRSDRGKQRALTDNHKNTLLALRTENPKWDAALLSDNLRHAGIEGPAPSYSTVLRYLKSQGYFPMKRHRRKADREVRSFEAEFVGELWHMDFHHGSRQIVDERGEFHKPICMAIIDDKSRLACHVQWFLNETAEVLCHGLTQAFLKRGLPRSFFTDNGAAMRAEELLAGLAHLGVKACRTLPYAAYQNGKQERFWKPLEGRLMNMLPPAKRLTLDVLNRVTQAWVEQEYQTREHREMKASPQDRFLKCSDVLRDPPSYDELRRAFRITTSRKQRRTDNTVTLDGVRFEVPVQYGHIENLTLRYARWDLGEAEIVCPDTHRHLTDIRPIDRVANARGHRKDLPEELVLRSPAESQDDGTILDLESQDLPPYLRHLLGVYAQQHALAGYIPLVEKEKKQ